MTRPNHPYGYADILYLSMNLRPKLMGLRFSLQSKIRERDEDQKLVLCIETQHMGTAVHEIPVCRDQPPLDELGRLLVFMEIDKPQSRTIPLEELDQTLAAIAYKVIGSDQPKKVTIHGHPY